MEICIKCSRELEEGENELCPACRSKIDYEVNREIMKNALFPTIPIIVSYFMGRNNFFKRKKESNSKKGENNG